MTQVDSTGKPTAEELRAAIAKRYEPPEWHIEREVTLDGRRLDVVAFNLWKAREFHVSGFELKVTRADWLRELEQFQKSARWCEVVDAFYLVTVPGIVREGELPAGWGHLELRGERLYTKAHAVVRPKGHTLPRELVARFLGRMRDRVAEAERNADFTARHALREEIRADIVREVERGHAREREELERLRTEQRELYEAMGVDRHAWQPHASVLRAALLFSEARKTGEADFIERQIERAAEQASVHHGRLRDALAAIRAMRGAA